MLCYASYICFAMLCYASYICCALLAIYAVLWLRAMCCIGNHLWHGCVVGFLQLVPDTQAVAEVLSSYRNIQVCVHAHSHAQYNSTTT